MKTKDFFDLYIQSALYQSFRSIAHYVDGFKPSSRKIIYTVIKNNINNKIKVAQLMSKTAEQTQYLHGEQSLYGTIVNLAVNYVGTNNINLLEPSGNFGCRFIPEAAAPRYIYTHKTPIFDLIFRKEDFDIIEKQEFEGELIEPKFYIPIIPLILINGSEGIGNGFSQLILPRNPVDVINEIKNYLKDKNYKCKNIIPYYKGFKGKIKKENKETSSYYIYGSFKIVNNNCIMIEELPVGVNLNSYISFLNKLVEDKLIKKYDDFSENDSFLFKIYLNSSSFIPDINDKENIYTKLKLVKKITENYTCIGVDNSIVEFNNEIEILEAYIKIRLEFYNKRKDYLLNKLQKEIDLLNSRMIFIEKIIKKELTINNQSKDHIINQLKKIPDIKTYDGSYDYLLKMPLYSLTKEKYNELEAFIKNKKEQYKTLSKTTINDLWLNELNQLLEHIK